MRLLSQFAQKIDASTHGIPTVAPSSALASVTTAVYFWAGIICVLIIIVAGFYYATSGGNPSNIKRAKDAILGAVVGLIVVLMAFVITQFLLGRV